VTLAGDLQREVDRAGDTLRHWSQFAISPVTIDASALHEREAWLPERGAQASSRNLSCRLLRCGDDWLAVNLPRSEDLDLIGALLGKEIGGCVWRELEQDLEDEDASHVMARSQLLGLAITRVGEAVWSGSASLLQVDLQQSRNARQWTRRPTVVDLSALWAGPLCGALLAEAGCDVIKIESLQRPDTTPLFSKEFDQRLNGSKRRLALDLSSEAGKSALRGLIERADVLITASRSRGLVSIGINNEFLRRYSRSGIWLAITAHGISGANSNRIGFGDDCAAAGGLIEWSDSKVPSFVGDAVADPLTGIAAAIHGMRALALGWTGKCDVNLAQTAALFCARLGEG
jgi:hypothetical protein